MTEATDPAASQLSRLGTCEVCAKKPARYACPKCEVKTCCVLCVLTHKRELKCDGKRDRTKFMPISDINEAVFMSDYCFLEECTRFTEARKRGPSKHLTQQRQLPLPLFRLRGAATQRGTRLLFLSAFFTRHKENKTYLNWKEQRIYWDIDWNFMHFAEYSAQFKDRRCNEDETLAELLKKYLDLQHETARDYRKALQHHQKAGIGQVSIWLKAECVRSSGRHCFRLATDKTLRANLAGRIIVEFPNIYITHDQQPPTGHEEIDSDEEAKDSVPSTSQPQPQPPAKRPSATATTGDVSTTEPQDVIALATSLDESDVSAYSTSSSSEEESGDDENPDKTLKAAKDSVPETQTSQSQMPAKRPSATATTGDVSTTEPQDVIALATNLDESDVSAYSTSSSSEEESGDDEIPDKKLKAAKDSVPETQPPQPQSPDKCFEPTATDEAAAIKKPEDLFADFELPSDDENPFL